MLVLALLAGPDLGLLQSAPPASPPTAEAPAQPASPISEDQLVLLAVQLDSLTLADALSAYGDPGDPYLPLSEIGRLLDLDLNVSAAEGRVTGSIGQAAQPLIIDVRIGLARLGAAPIQLAADDTAIAGSEIYVRSSALARILPARFESDSEALTLTIVPSETLPIQSRLERLARIRGLAQDSDTPEERMRIASPYRLFSPPAFDAIFDTGSDTRGVSFSRRYNLRAAGDIFYAGFEGYLGSDETGRATDARVLLERRSLEGRLLGPVGATRVSGGDVFTPALALGPRSVPGRGFSFSTAPLEQASVFETIDLRGELPIGHDVELYINDVLRSGQSIPVQGRFEFLNVPLVRGINVIRIVSFGPRGERSEQVRVVNVSGGQVPRGSTVLEFGAVEQERPLIEIDRNRSTLPGAGELRVVASLAHGLTEGLTLVGGVAVYPGADARQRRLITTGLRTSILGMAVRADLAADQQGGRAAAFGMAGRVAGVSLVAEHFEYRGGFRDENLLFADANLPLVRHSELSVDFNLPAGRELLVPISARALRNEFAGGGSNWIAQIRASATLAHFLVSTGLDYQRRSLPGSPLQEQLGGIFSASRFINFQWQLRASLDYSIRPRPELRALSLTADRSLSDRVAIRFGVGHSFQQPRSTAVQAGASIRFPFGDLSLAGDFALPRGDWGVGIRFAFGLAFDPHRRRYRVTPPGAATGGSASIRAFVDDNGNGRFDRGEEPVSGASIEGAERGAVTDAGGTAFVVGLGSAPTARLQIGTDKIDIENVTPPPSTVEFSPRPGKVLRIDYPLAPSRELFVRVVFKRGDEMVGISAVRLLLVREGAEPQMATTEFDGTASFPGLAFGQYRLELDPEQAERLHMQMTEPVTVAISAEGHGTVEATAQVRFERPGGIGERRDPGN